MRRQKVAISFGHEKVAGVLFKDRSSSKTPLPCLVICHGAFEYKENFFELGQYLSDQGRGALVIDMPGHGESTGERFHINIDLWVRSIRAAIDWITDQPEIDHNRIGAFGFSSGGTAVFEAALADKRLKALITLDATVRNYLDPWDTLTFKTLNAVGILKKKITGSDLRLKLVHVLHNARVAHDPKVNQSIISDPKMIEAYAAFPLPGATPCAFVDTIKRLNAISAPTLVIHGQDDHIDPPDTASMIFNTLTCEKSLEFLPQSGHCGHLDTQKDKMMQLTAQWASKHL